MLPLHAAIVSTMTAAHIPAEPVAPPADPKAIRACLSARLAAEFDREWNIVLDRVKQSMNLADVQKLLHKWRHTAYMEMRDPGSYYRMLAQAEHALATGEAPAGSVSGEEMLAELREQLGR